MVVALIRNKAIFPSKNKSSADWTKDDLEHSLPGQEAFHVQHSLSSSAQRRTSRKWSVARVRLDESSPVEHLERILCARKTFVSYWFLVSCHLSGGMGLTCLLISSSAYLAVGIWRRGASFPSLRITKARELGNTVPGLLAHVTAISPREWTTACIYRSGK
jgi:hypothetical protein